MIRADLHIHTCYSVDSLTSLERVVAQCLQVGIDCVAVADHNTIDGALRLREIAPFKVIVAEEIRTPQGEIMGLFLSERVPGGLSPAETMARIRDQGGLVAIPHPFGRPFFGSTNRLTTPEIVSRVDIIETYNSRTPLPRSIAKARRLAMEYGKPGTAGSDAHTAGEIGHAYVEMPEFDGPEGFLHSLARGTIHGHQSSHLAHFASTWAKLRKRIPGSSPRSSP